MTHSSEFSVEGTASVKDEMLDEKALAIAAEAYEEANGLIGDHEQMRQALKAYLAAAPSRDQVSMGALREARELRLAIANALVAETGRSIDGLCSGDYTDASAGSLLGKAWHNAGVALSALSQPSSLDEQTEWNETRYAEQLATSLAAKHYPEVTQWRPLSGDLMGLLSQIDNMTTGLVRAAPSSLVPTAEQGVAAWRCSKCGGASFSDVDELKADGHFAPGPNVRCVNCKAVSPIAGAGEEPDWFAKFNKHGECVSLKKTQKAAEDEEGMWEGDTIVPLYSAASISQLNSRIGGLEAEVARLTPLAVAYDYLEAPDAIDWKARAEAAEAKLAEAREVLEELRGMLLRLHAKAFAQYPMGRVTLEVVDEIKACWDRARSFHSAKKPAGGGE